MWRSVRVTSLILAAAAGSPAQSLSSEQTEKPGQAAKPPFSITISTPHDVVKAGEPVSVDITLSNISSRKIFFHSYHSPDPDKILATYGIEVRDSRGDRVLRSQRRAKEFPPWIEHSIVYSLEPGKTTNDRLEIGEVQDISKPGKYTIQLQRSEYETKIAVKSNTITVTVTN